MYYKMRNKKNKKNRKELPIFFAKYTIISYSVATKRLSFFLLYYYCKSKVHFLNISSKTSIMGFQSAINLDVFSLIEEVSLAISPSFIIFTNHSFMVGNAESFHF